MFISNENLIEFLFTDASADDVKAKFMKMRTLSVAMYGDELTAAARKTLC